MIGATIEVGSNVLALLAPLVAVLVAIAQNYRTNSQLKPNGGSTLRDAIDRTEKAVAGITSSVEGQSSALAELTTVVGKLDERLQAVEHPAAVTVDGAVSVQLVDGQN